MKRSSDTGSRFTDTLTGVRTNAADAKPSTQETSAQTKIVSNEQWSYRKSPVMGPTAMAMLLARP